jgi:hypothetical protein
MGMIRSTLFMIALLTIVAPPATAHHGPGTFDLSKTVTLTGKLTRIDLINPHSWLYFDVTEPDGRVTHHRCEMRSVHVLRRSGWTKEQFPVGARIVIEASPDRADPTSCYLQTITFPDGTHMDRYGQYTKAPQGGVQEVRGPVVVPKTKRELRRPTGEPNITGDWAAEQLAAAWFRSASSNNTSRASGQLMQAGRDVEVRVPEPGRGFMEAPS